MEEERDICQHSYPYKYDITAAKLGAALAAVNVVISFFNWDPIRNVNLYGGIAGGIAAGAIAVSALLAERRG